NGGEVDEGAARIGEAFDENGAGLRVDLPLEAGNVVGVGPAHLPAEIAECVAELVDGAAIELAGGNEVLTRAHQRMEDEHLRGMAGGSGQCGGAALERRQLLLQHGLGRIHDPGVDVAESLQPEQRGGVIGALEDEGGGLVDRGRPCARGRIGPGSGMYCQRVECRCSLRHDHSLLDQRRPPFPARPAAWRRWRADDGTTWKASARRLWLSCAIATTASKTGMP